MLFVICAKDYKKLVAEVTKKTTAILKINADANVEKFLADNLKKEDLIYKAEGNSLFGNVSLNIVNEYITKNREDFLDIIPKLAVSKNYFIFTEDEVNKETEKEILKYKGEYLAIKNDEKEKTNPFAITDALLAKDKKKLWLLYRQEIDTGESAEAILGRFVWAIKTLTLIQKNPNQNAVDLGISPFVYSKTKSAGKVWKDGEPEEFYTKLLFGIKDGEEMEYHLEKLILS